MKLRGFVSAVAFSISLFATSAQSAVLDLTELLSFRDGRFTNSVIHNQRWHRRHGNVTVAFNSAITGGEFNTDSGEIKFNGTIRRGDQTGLIATGNFTAMGTLLTSTTRQGGFHGNIRFSFTGDLLGGRNLNFRFRDKTYKSGSKPNGYASNSTHKYIALWGDLNNYDEHFCKTSINACQGIDLLIAYEERTVSGGSSGGIVPLPASAFFLLAGIGGLGVTRKLRKKA